MVTSRVINSRNLKQFTCLGFQSLGSNNVRASSAAVNSRYESSSASGVFHNPIAIQIAVLLILIMIIMRGTAATTTTAALFSWRYY